jgi:hypothetical protein
VTFLLDLRLDLALDPGLSIPPIGRSLYGYPRVRIYLASRPNSLTVDVNRTLEHVQSFFDGVRFTLDPRVDWEALALSSTVASVTILHPTRAARFRPTDRWMTLRFEDAVAVLDRVLSCIGFLAGLPDVGALRRSDFPASVLVALNDRVLEPGNRDVLLSEMQLHSFEEGRSALADSQDIFATAIWLAEYLVGEGASARLFVDYAQRASRDLLDGRPDQAVISATTAIETLTAAVLTELWSHAGDSIARIHRRLEAGFQNLLRDHLRSYLQAAGADETPIADWLAECYVLRNRVVHEGTAPTQQVAANALGATMRLGITIAEALRSDARTRWLGEAIPLRSQKPTERGHVQLARILGRL